MRRIRIDQVFAFCAQSKERRNSLSISDLLTRQKAPTDDNQTFRDANKLGIADGDEGFRQRKNELMRWGEFEQSSMFES